MWIKMICFNSECSKEFNPKTHNQKYCSDNCCRLATNKKIMEKYYEKKAIKGGVKRSCTKCNSRLSRYNSEKICAKCIKSNNSQYKSELLEAINDASKP